MKGRIAIIVVVLAVISAGLAGADYVVKERPREIVQPETDTGAVMPEPEQPQVPVPTEPRSEPSSGSSSSSNVVKKGVSTKKKAGPDVLAVLASLQLTPTATSEASLIGLTNGSGSLTMVLLADNDRAALFSWIENDDVKTMFSALKQALQEQFSPGLKDLTDETRTPETGPPVDILSFYDPAISPEKVIFLRVRTRLYELHVAEKGTELVNRLIEELSK